MGRGVVGNPSHKEQTIYSVMGRSHHIPARLDLGYCTYRSTDSAGGHYSKPSSVIFFDLGPSSLSFCRPLVHYCDPIAVPMGYSRSAS